VIAITDYGMGNLRSVQKALERLGGEAVVTSGPEAIDKADKVILPGVGAFKDAMDELRTRGLLEPVRNAALTKPFLGICLGLQLLFTESEEDGLHRGMGILSGRIVRFRSEQFPEGAKRKVPHMGWNANHLRKDIPLFRGLADGVYTYFVHSYYACPDDESVIAATADYGAPFPSVVAKGSLFATQFHPEKSQSAGLRILQNFLDV
jgi:glutamine amidotransferase